MLRTLVKSLTHILTMKPGTQKIGTVHHGPTAESTVNILNAKRSRDILELMKRDLDW